MPVFSDVIDGYEKFKSASEKWKQGQLVLFTGSLDESGHSWCPDCVLADPVIEKTFEKSSEGMSLIKVFVGDRPTWKSRDCPFRKDPSTMLMVIPTLIKWKSPQKLEGEQCAKEELIEMMFED